MTEEPGITPPCANCGHTRSIHEADDSYGWCLYAPPRCPCKKYVVRKKAKRAD